MRRMKELEQKVEALAKYLNIDFEKTDGFEVREQKKEIGFGEK